MKCLHGVLLWLAASLVAGWIAGYVLAPSERDLMRPVLFYACATFAPFMGLTYRSISSNQY